MDWRVDPGLVNQPNGQWPCEARFTGSDQVALISTETGWVCQLPVANYAVWQNTDLLS